MIKEADIRRNHGGFTLIELIVSMLIMSIIALIVVMLLTSSRATYRSVDVDAVIQNETNMVKNFVGELAIEAINCGYDDIDDNFSYIWFEAPDNATEGNNAEGEMAASYYYYFLLLERDTGILRYTRFQKDNAALKGTDDNIFGTGFSFKKLLVEDASTRIAGDKYQLLAEHISDLVCTQNSGLITLELYLKYDDVVSKKTLLFAGRNIRKKIEE